MRVTWEKYANARPITQCRKCQRWGHSQTYCHQQARCLKCAQEHSTYQCKKPPNVPAICANCDGPHPASDINCPVYIYKLEMLKKRQTATQQLRNNNKPTTSLVPAPLPKTNPWARTAAPPTATVTRNHQVNKTSQQHNTPITQRSTDTQVSDFTQSTASVDTVTIIQPAANSQQPTANKFSDLAAAINELNKTTNIDEMIRLINDLTNALKKSTNKMDRFNTILTFTQNIDSYDI